MQEGSSNTQGSVLEGSGGEESSSKDGRLVGGSFCRIKYEPINLNSSQAVKNYLLSQGWVPTTFNYQKDARGYFVKDDEGSPIPTSPKLTEDSFESVTGDIPKLVARRNILIHRQRLLDNVRNDGTLSGLLNYVRDDGRVEARCIPQSTNTGRATHAIVVNIPSVHAVYGKEIRDLFVAREGYEFVGVDAAALEARVFAHFMLNYPGGDVLADLVLHGDIHQENADMWHCSRNDAKSPYYALMYGSQIPKFSATLGVDIRTGTRYYNAFWEKYRPLELLKQDLTKAWEARGGKKGGFIKGIDGRKLHARSQHSLVNLMFQSTGSIVVKVAGLYTDKWKERKKLDVNQWLFYHDEYNYECLKQHTEQFLPLTRLAFKKAGEFFKLNVEIVGEPKVGPTYLSTH
jgi:DNA polymerase I